MQARRRFRFIKELAQGGFGKVYMAEMVTGDNFSSVVAIKVLHGRWSTHEEIVQRSRDEARLLGRLRHRSIVRVEDLTAITGQCAIIMEYLEGVDLKTLVNHLAEQGQSMPARATFEIIGAVASALDSAYNTVPLQAQGHGGEPLRLIHRDIKPSNVMLTVEGDVKLLDFGTARANFESREAKTQALAFGSQAYMAPERVAGDPDTPSGDIFSLGVTLYEILSGSAFGKIHIRPEKYEKALQQRLEQLTIPDASGALVRQVQQVLRSMLAYDPEERLTAAQVVEAMEKLSDDARDTTLRRLAKDVVRPCMVANPHTPDPEDPLTGTTVVEDRTGLPISGDPSGPVPAVDNATTFEETGSRKRPADSGVFLQPLPLPLQSLPPAPMPLVEGQTIAPDDPDDDIEEAPAPSPPPPAPPAAAPPAPPTLAPAPALPSQALRPAPTLIAFDDDEVDSTVVAPPRPEVRPAEPPRPAAEPPRPAPPARPAEPPAAESPPAKKSSSPLPFVLAAVLLLVVGGGAAGAWVFTHRTPTTPPPVEVPDVPVEVAPAQEEVLPPPTAEAGNLRLQIVPAGTYEVDLTSSAGFKADKRGAGVLGFAGVPKGTLRTKVKGASGDPVRGTLSAEPGKTCTFSLDMSAGQWVLERCE